MENILIKKLHIKPGRIIAIINPPDNYLNRLNPLPEGTTFSSKFIKAYNFVQYFVLSKNNLEAALIKCKKIGDPAAIVWITYPKQSSNIKTDLNRDTSFPILKKHGFTVAAIVSIDETWSALRIKLIMDSINKKSGRQKNDNFTKYIDRGKRIITPPEDLKKGLDKNKSAYEFFNSLAFTHKKEYVQWILEAKKEDTRNKRIVKTIAMLLNGQRNPFN
jgi:hypothetical protein